MCEFAMNHVPALKSDLRPQRVLAEGAVPCFTHHAAPQCSALRDWAARRSAGGGADGEVRPAVGAGFEKVGVQLQVFAALRTAESMLEPAQFEIYVGALFGRPFYLPRVLACCMGRRRDFPRKRMQSLCHTIRCVARVQLGMVSLFSSGTADDEMEALQQSDLSRELPRLVERLDCVWQVCSGLQVLVAKRDKAMLLYCLRRT
jgi:hypothetical protein